LTEEDLNKIVSKKGYGVISSSIKSSLGQRAISSEIDRQRQEHDLEPNPSDESLGSKKLQIGCSGKVHVFIKFYRRRLADYSRAISEKAIVDCLQYAGIISGDSEKEIWLEDGGQEKVESNEEERTELTISYPEVDLDNLWEKAPDSKIR
jgi:hypothetical protein